MFSDLWKTKARKSFLDTNQDLAYLQWYDDAALISGVWIALHDEIKALAFEGEYNAFTYS